MTERNCLQTLRLSSFETPFRFGQTGYKTMELLFCQSALYTTDNRTLPHSIRLLSEKRIFGRRLSVEMPAFWVAHSFTHHPIQCLLPPKVDHIPSEEIFKLLSSSKIASLVYLDAPPPLSSSLGKVPPCMSCLCLPTNSVIGAVPAPRKSGTVVPISKHNLGHFIKAILSHYHYLFRA